MDAQHLGFCSVGLHGLTTEAGEVAGLRPPRRVLGLSLLSHSTGVGVLMRM